MWCGNPQHRPIEEYDPLKNTDDLPGEDGSPEKIAAIQKRIEVSAHTMHTI